MDYSKKRKNPIKTASEDISASETDIIDIENMLNPVSEDQPAGEWIRYEETYDIIKEARREDDPGLPQGVWERDLKKADWGKVRNICINALETRTKDLQIAMWLLESLLHIHGFAGVREGLRFSLRLCEEFWDILYPEAGEDDLDSRLFPLIWMNEKLFLKLKTLPFTMPESIDHAPYTFVDWENANVLEKAAAKDKKILERAESQNKVTRAKFLGSVMLSPRAFYSEQYHVLSQCIESLDAFNSFLDERCGKDAPSLKQFRDTLKMIMNLTNRFLSEKKEDGAYHHQADIPDPLSSETHQKEGEKTVFLSFRNRAEAYKTLSEAADYLMIHEPHSPTPYLVKRAVSWGHMTLGELMNELVNDENDLKNIFRLLGLKK